MVKRISDKGGVYYEPPYTEQEEIMIYLSVTGAVNAPGLTILHQAPPVPSPQPQSPPKPEEK